MPSLAYVVSHPFSRLTSLLNIDPDLFLLKSLVAVVIALWPLGFVGYLVTVYGSRILCWYGTVGPIQRDQGKKRAATAPAIALAMNASNSPCS